MITLYQYPPAFGLPVSVSPFCAKLEAYLRLTQRDYTTAVANPPRSPNRLVPYIGRDGKLQADSGAIIAELESAGPALDADLDGDQRNKSAELTALAEEQLYFALLYCRFADPGGWTHQAAAVKAVLPWFLGFLVGMIRRSQVKKAAAHGFADDDSAYAQATAIVGQIAAALGDQPFLLGDAPHIVDCSVWGNLLHAGHTWSRNPLTEAVRGEPRLMAYLERMNQRLDLAVPAPRYA